MDHCVPQRLRSAFTGHDVQTAQYAGWERLKNGALLAAAAEAGFDALITADQNLSKQQSLAWLPIAVVVMVSVSNDIDALSGLVPRVLEALRELRPRSLVELRL